MSANSKIEWTDHTFNPWIGCTKVSPGCANCYAESEDKRRGWTPEGWGKGKPRQRTSEAYWKQPLKWNRIAAWPSPDIIQASCPVEIPGPRPRVFCASLADWLDDEVPIEWLADLLALIHATPNLDWQLLTKRPENFVSRVLEVITFVGSNFRKDDSEITIFAHDWLTGKAPANVWVGASVEDQKRADERIPQLLKIPAEVRFLSCEPLLGPVNIDLVWHNCPNCGAQKRATQRTCIASDCMASHNVGVDWVIAGGESGHGARPMHPEWARGLRDQCVAAGVPFFFKQWGEYGPAPDLRLDRRTEVVDGGMAGLAHMRCVGKRAAGRLLDGREWSEFPQSQVANRQSAMETTS